MAGIGIGRFPPNFFMIDYSPQQQQVMLDFLKGVSFEDESDQRLADLILGKPFFGEKLELINHDFKWIIEVMQRTENNYCPKYEFTEV